MERIPDSWADELQNLVNKKYVVAQKANHRFSKRRYAQILGLSSGALSEFMSGKRRLRPTSALRIVDALDLAKRQRNRLRALIQPDSKDQRVSLQDRQYWVLTNWNAHLVYTLFAASPKMSLAEASLKTSMTQNEVLNLLEELISLNFFKRSSHGELQIVADRWTSTNDIPSKTIQQHHRVSLNSALKSLSMDQVSERSISGISFVINPQCLVQLQNDIYAFYEKLENLYAADEGSVYRVAIQCFPIRKSED